MRRKVEQFEKEELAKRRVKARVEAMERAHLAQERLEKQTAEEEAEAAG